MLYEIRNLNSQILKVDDEALGRYFLDFRTDDAFLKFIKWEDDEPYEIEKLLDIKDGSILKGDDGEMTHERKRFLEEITDLWDKNLMGVIQRELINIEEIYLHDPELYSYCRTALDLYGELRDIKEDIERIICGYNTELNNEI